MISGGPGAGKGTQCALLAQQYDYAHLSTGDLLRAEVLAGTQRWVRLFETITNGLLVPDVSKPLLWFILDMVDDVAIKGCI